MSIVNGQKITTIMASAANGDTYGDAERRLFRGIQTLVMPNIISASLSTPPVSPINGQTYIVGSAPTGAWSGQANSIAYYAVDPQDGVATTGIWEFYQPQAGWHCFNQATGSALTWNGFAWAPPVIVSNLTTVTPVAGNVIVNAALGNSFVLGLLPGVNTLSITNPTNGQTITLLYQQNGGGGTVAYPGNVHNIGFVGGAGTLSAVDLELGTADQYAILGVTVTNSGSSVIGGGNVGATTFTAGGWVLTPPTVVVNPPPAQAETDLNTAITFYSTLTPTQTLTTADMGTQNTIGGGSPPTSAPVGHYYPGVYNSPSSLAITTPITLDAQGNPNALFVFHAGVTPSTITQQIAGTISLINGAQASNVVWVCGSAWTTIGPGAVTIGDILAGSSITLGGGTLTGRALASSAVTISTATNITSPAAIAAGAFHAQPSPTNGAVSSQSFTYNSATSTWYQTAPGTYGL